MSFRPCLATWCMDFWGHKELGRQKGCFLRGKMTNINTNQPSNQHNQPSSAISHFYSQAEAVCSIASPRLRLRSGSGRPPHCRSSLAERLAERLAPHPPVLLHGRSQQDKGPQRQGGDMWRSDMFRKSGFELYPFDARRVHPKRP